MQTEGRRDEMKSGNQSSGRSWTQLLPSPPPHPLTPNPHTEARNRPPSPPLNINTIACGFSFACDVRMYDVLDQMPVWVDSPGKALDHDSGADAA